MKRWLLPILGLLLISQAHAAEGIGVGVVVGSPNGLTARHWLNENSSVEGAVGWSLSESRFQANVNYLLNRPDLLELGGETFDVFFGAGLGLRNKSGKANGEVVFGPRFPVGVSYEFADPNIELFAQAAVNVGLIPSSDLFFDGNLGVRFYLF